MTRSSAILGSGVFFFLAPGIVAFLIPLVIGAWPVDPLYRDLPWINWLGLAFAAAGFVALVECFARFALDGQGTPAPIAPPRHLVVTGLYRHVRNPIYVAVLTIILGWGLWFASWAVFAYAVLVWFAFTAFVMGYEEPVLRKDYGEEYVAYCANVGRWIPRLSPWRASV